MRAVGTHEAGMHGGHNGRGSFSGKREDFRVGGEGMTKALYGHIPKPDKNIATKRAKITKKDIK
jgi:hypothetical protein